MKNSSKKIELFFSVWGLLLMSGLVFGKLLASFGLIVQALAK